MEENNIKNYQRRHVRENNSHVRNRSGNIEFHPKTGSVKSMNFENYAAEGNRFINEVADELDVDRNRAARVTRAVLHAIRDRIPADDAIQFAQGLPMALKGVFIEGYDISLTPIVIRNPKNFIDFIYSKNGKAAHSDFPSGQYVIEALRGVFRVLERNMDYGQVHQIKNLINAEIIDLIEQ